MHMCWVINGQVHVNISLKYVFFLWKSLLGTANKVGQNPPDCKKRWDCLRLSGGMSLEALPIQIVFLTFSSWLKLWQAVYKMLLHYIVYYQKPLSDYANRVERVSNLSMGNSDGKCHNATRGCICPYCWSSFFTRSLNLAAMSDLLSGVKSQNWKCCTFRGFWSFVLHKISQVEDTTVEEMGNRNASLWDNVVFDDLQRCDNPRWLTDGSDHNRYTVVSGYKPWARSAWQRDNTGSGTQNGAFASKVYLA